MNKVIMNGNLARDPDIKVTSSGKPYARFVLTVNRLSGKTADFFDFVAWEKLATFCERFLKKGSAIIVDGRAETYNYEDNSGIKHFGVNFVAERIDFAASKNSSTASPTTSPSNDGDDDSDLPF